VNEGTEELALPERRSREALAGRTAMASASVHRTAAAVRWRETGAPSVARPARGTTER